MSNRDKFLTVDHIADRLAISTRTVRRWIDLGELPVYRLGRAIRVAEADLTDFLSRKRITKK